MSDFAAVVLAAGQGTRMKSDLPKVLHPLAGRPMIGHLLAEIGDLGPARTVVVVSPQNREAIAKALPDAVLAVQDPPQGTGHAVMAALPALAGFDGDVVVLFGDTPFLSHATVQRMLDERAGARDPAVVVMGFRPDDAAEYGRLIVAPDGSLSRIVEFRDACEAERASTFCNSGVMAIDGRALPGLLARLSPENAKREYYLTDLVGLARSDGRWVTAGEGAADDALGINSRAHLAEAEALLQDRLRRRAMDGGATLTDPKTVWFSHDTVLGRDVTVGPNVVFGPGVTVGDRAEIRAFSHLEGAAVAAGALIGPFARLRPGAEIGVGAHVGNFVEIKQARVEEGAKVNHLTYIGDARVGAGANVGAGTITCNYDGFGKYHTDIGAGAFIGSNTALVAPVRIGDRAIVGAGSTIGRDVPDDALAITRAEQTVREGYAPGYRAERKAAADRARRERG